MYFGKTSEQGERSRCIVKISKVGFAVKTRRNLCLVWCVRKTHCLPMFRINRQIPRCVLTWVMVVVAFCYDVLCEPCDGFSDLPSVLLEFLCYTWGFAFDLGFPQWAGSFFVYVWGFKKDSFTLVVASWSLLGRWVEHLKFLFIFENGGVLPR